MIYFISGIDTDVGKTVAVGALAAALTGRGQRVITQKPVQTGNIGFSEDLAMHRKMCGLGQMPEDQQGLTAPIIFPVPCSPHLAARLAGKSIDPEVIRRATDVLASRYDVVLIEGAGGLMVPLTDTLLTIDYAAMHNYPVILVTSCRLGGINHTLLSFEALKHRKMTLAGVVYNLYPPTDQRLVDDAREVIHRYLMRDFPMVWMIDLPVAEPEKTPQLIIPENFTLNEE